MELTVANCPSQDLAKTNQLFVSPGSLGAPSSLLEIGAFVYLVREDAGVSPGSLGMNAIQRRSLRLSSGDRVQVAPFHAPPSGLEAGLVGLEVELVSRRGGELDTDADELSKHCAARLAGQVLTEGQELTLEHCGVNFLFAVSSLEVADGQGSQARARRGLVFLDTTVSLEAKSGGGVRLKGQRSLANSLFRKKDVSFTQLGIGGLDAQFHEMFRRAFHSRLLSPSLAERLGIKHVKGILLYGPPGTGKTLIARQIGRLLNGKEPKVVNGPEVLNKYVGASEENIRALFKDAETEYAKRGDDSDLHVIIFDEIDAICKSRGSVRDGSGVHDTVVNQLLTKLDGVDALNNILVIGMTNRKELLDEALLRQGRLEVHLEIGLPDERGRLQIFQIHTRRMSENTFLNPDVDLVELAARTPNFSGAEIEGLVRSATSFALDRQIRFDELHRPLDEGALRVGMADFAQALQEVTPAFGADSDRLQSALSEGVFSWGPRCQRLVAELDKLVRAVRDGQGSALLTVCLHGPRGTGKTAVAADVALRSRFPFVKLLGPDSLVGLSEQGKCQRLIKVFDDACKSPLSIVILDDVERLIEFIFMGPRFSNAILQDVLTCLARPPPAGRRLLVLATTSSRQVVELLGGAQAFTEEHRMEPLSLNEAHSVVQQAGDQAGLDYSQAAHALLARGEGLTVPVKRLLLLLRLARQELPEGETSVPRAVFDQLIQNSKLLPEGEDVDERY